MKPKKKEKYEDSKVEKLRLFLETQAGKGHPRYYEIYVDNLKVVGKTNDVSEFDAYEDMMTDDTSEVKVVIYSTSATSPRNDQYVFTCTAEDETPVPVTQPVLNGIDIEKRIEEKLEQQQQRWESDLVKRDLEATKKQLKEAEEYIGKLETEVETFRAKKMHWGNVNVAEMAGVVLEGVVKRNPHWLAKIPGAEQLAGLIAQEQAQGQITQAQPEAEATFKKKEATVVDAVVLSEEEKGYINFMRSLAENFDDKELALLTKIIDYLEQDPSQLPTVADLLGIKVQE